MKRTLIVTGLVVILSVVLVILSGIYVFVQPQGWLSAELTQAGFMIFVMFCINLLFQIIFFIRRYSKYKKSLEENSTESNKKD